MNIKKIKSVTHEILRGEPMIYEAPNKLLVKVKRQLVSRIGAEIEVAFDGN